MAPIIIEKVTKVYSNDFTALHELDLQIADGEFMVLVGPSGCGKTTALRLVAGLEDISSGTLKIGNKVMNHVASRDRDIAMVFQNYALYPHMTVSENIGFGLTLRKLPRDDIKRKVESAAALLGLTEWLHRKPGQLSGGQRQRVAMGRAIVREPSVFLMDEPLSNLDAKLRVQMRAEVARIQRKLGVATLYVTHDQVEAMTMGDRVAVLRGGLLQQCDKPQAVYDNPQNLFVAAFIGSPAMNLFEGLVREGGNDIVVGSQHIELPDALHAIKPRLRSYANRQIVLGIRPEDLVMSRPGVRSANTHSETAILGADVDLVEALGSDLLVHFTIDATRVEAEGATESDAAGLSMGQLQKAGEGIARIEPRAQLRVGNRVHFEFEPLRLHFFDRLTGEAITS